MQLFPCRPGDEKRISIECDGGRLGKVQVRLRVAPKDQRRGVELAPFEIETLREEPGGTGDRGVAPNHKETVLSRHDCRPTDVVAAVRGLEDDRRPAAE